MRSIACWAARDPALGRGLEGLGLTAPLVGRERELRRMEAAFDEMRAGRPRC